MYLLIPKNKRRLVHARKALGQAAAMLGTRRLIPFRSSRPETMVGGIQRQCSLLSRVRRRAFDLQDRSIFLSLWWTNPIKLFNIRNSPKYLILSLFLSDPPDPINISVANKRSFIYFMSSDKLSYNRISITPAAAPQCVNEPKFSSFLFRAALSTFNIDIFGEDGVRSAACCSLPAPPRRWYDRYQ